MPSFTSFANDMTENVLKIRPVAGDIMSHYAQHMQPI